MSRQQLSYIRKGDKALSCHLGSFLWRLRLLLLARSLRGRPIELLGFHVRARFAEAVPTQDMLADGTVIFRVELQKCASNVQTPKLQRIYCQTAVQNTIGHGDLRLTNLHGLRVSLPPKLAESNLRCGKPIRLFSINAKHHTAQQKCTCDERAALRITTCLIEDHE